MPDMLDPLKERPIHEDEEHVDGSVFASQEDITEEPEEEKSAPDTFEELPIEIRSLTERYWATYSRDILFLTVV